MPGVVVSCIFLLFRIRELLKSHDASIAAVAHLQSPREIPLMIRLLWEAAFEVSSGAFALAYHPGIWVVLEVRHLVRHLYGGYSDPAWWTGLPA
jgi:hypothetical protein